MGCGCAERRRRLAAFAARMEQKVAEFLGAKQAARAQAKGQPPAPSVGADSTTEATDWPALAPSEGSDP